ncbi:MAG: hypothetical protein M0Z66_05750 [Thermaerobacter sp.]|nr:hypothetical protein [Thermaerobacter sp.]
MSTKIFNGYMLGFSAMTDIWVIDQWASVFRKRISHMEDDLRARLFATVTATLVDRIALLDDPKRLLSIVNGLTDENAKTLSDHRTPFMVAFEHIANHEKKIRETSMRDPDYDFECNVQILHVPGRNILLAMLFTEQEAYRILWRRMPHVQEYAYWNSTDQPSYLTDEQWDRRRRDWDKALGEDGIPSLHGFGIDCHHVYGHPNLEQILQRMPTFQSRVRQSAADNLFREWLDGRELTASNIIAMERQFKAWRKTTHGRLAAVKLRHNVAQRLPQEITREMLTTSVKSLFETFQAKTNHGEGTV